MTATIAAIVYCAATAVVVAFQLALAAGAPWGELAMGSRYPGRFPPALRVGAVVQGLLLAGLAFLVCARAGLGPSALEAPSRNGIWVVVAITVVSLILNVITPSRRERALWAPTALVLTVTSLLVATS
ncbi:MAG: hypothetical protein R3E86_06685 [Pseudomonadales bacterium]